MSLPIEAVKGLVLGALFILTFTFSMIPLKFVALSTNVTINPERRQRFQQAVSFLSCFAAGVFLGTCFLDLFPEVKDKMVEVFFVMKIYSTFPIAEFLMIFGFFLILIIEQVSLTVKESQLEESEVTKPLIQKRRKHKKYQTVNTDHACDENHIHDSFQNSYSSQGSFEGISDRPVSPSASIDRSVSIDRSYSGDDDGIVLDADHSMHIDQSSHSRIRSIILVIALSLHSVFEGLAVGLQPTSQEVIQIFSALVLHKSILAFSLGLNLMQSRFGRGAAIRANLLFSIASPLGIGVGIAIVDLSESMYSSLANGLLQGIACGTFLYVTFFEVLPHEFNNSDNRLLKLLFLILGYATIAAIQFIHPETYRPPCYKGPIKP
jgi:zinc transporter 1/2/3